MEEDKRNKQYDTDNDLGFKQVVDQSPLESFPEDCIDHVALLDFKICIFIIDIMIKYFIIFITATF